MCTINLQCFLTNFPGIMSYKKRNYARLLTAFVESTKAIKTVTNVYRENVKLLKKLHRMRATGDFQVFRFKLLRCMARASEER